MIYLKNENLRCIAVMRTLSQVVIWSGYPLLLEREKEGVSCHYRTFFYSRVFCSRDQLPDYHHFHLVVSRPGSPYKPEPPSGY